MICGVDGDGEKAQWDNLKVNPEHPDYYRAMISMNGGKSNFDEAESGKRELYQQFVNAQHDVYHRPDKSRWLKYPAYVFDIEEVYDNSASREGFGTKLEFPY